MCLQSPRTLFIVLALPALLLSAPACTSTAALADAFNAALGGIVGDPNSVDPNATPTPGDTDGDGLSDEQEAALGTDPNDIDSDNDRVRDDDEIEFETDPTRANSVGTFDQRFCVDFLIPDGIPAGQPTIFRGSATVVSWRAGDVLILSDDETEIINKTRAQRSTVQRIGAPTAELQLVSLTTNGETLRLSNGTLWRPAIAERFTVLSWQPADDVTTVEDVDGNTLLLNTTRCETVAATRQS